MTAPTDPTWATPRILVFADFLEEQVPEPKFNMREWLIVPDDDRGYGDPDPHGGYSIGLAKHLRDAIAPDAKERDYSCLTSACAAGWAVLWAERVREDEPVDMQHIEEAALAHLIADLETNEHLAAAVRRRLRAFFERDTYRHVTTPAEAAAVIRKIYWDAQEFAAGLVEQGSLT